jgi:D-alanine-D-alanine ligase
MSKIRVAVVMGGPSAEREVSIESGQAVMRALATLGHDAQSLDFDGRFVDALREIAPDVVFNALHGTGGEDGTIQGILEWLGIPYTGSDVTSCALAMDKHLTKKLLTAEGSIVRTHEEWTKAMINVAPRTTQVIAEEYIPGREFASGVLGEEALPLVEIIAGDEFYSYDAKYKPGGSRHLVPAPIDDDLTARLQMLALSVHRLLGLRDYSRTDIIVTKEGRPYILEINALPGLTPLSLLPDEVRAAGISFEALIERLLQYALGRAVLV